MRPKVLHFLMILSLLALALLALGGDQAQAQEGAPQAPQALSDEAWRYGVTVEGALTYAALDGRLLSDVAAFRSARDDDIYFVFPAASTAKTVTSIRYNIVSRSGSYTGDALLSLQVYSIAGVLHHTVTSGSANMEAGTVGTWNAIGLSATAANRVVNPGQFLAFHFDLSAAAGDNLDVRPIFEVILQ